MEEGVVGDESGDDEDLASVKWGESEGDWFAVELILRQG